MGIEEGCKGGMWVCNAVLRCACHVWYGKPLIGRGMVMCVGIWWACVEAVFECGRHAAGAMRVAGVRAAAVRTAAMKEACVYMLWCMF